MGVHARSRGRRYRGEHRQDGLRFAVGELQDAVAESAEQVRREHLRALRRLGAAPTMVYLGEYVWRPKFYGVVPDDAAAEAGAAYITIEPEPDPGFATLPVLPGLPLLSDDAPTGPIIAG